MWNDGSTISVGNGSDVVAIDDRTSELSHAEGDRWVSMKAISRLLGINHHGQLAEAWDWLVAMTECGRTPEIMGQPIRMAVTTIRGRDWWCMHEDDMRRVAGSFHAFVGTFQSILDRKYARRDPIEHSEWLGYRAVAGTLPMENPETLLNSVWQHLQREYRGGRVPRLGDHEIRMRYFAGDKGRAIHIHRDDVRFLDQNIHEDGSCFTLRDVVDHFRDLDEWMGLHAERLMKEVRTGFGTTGRLALRGIPLATVRVPTERGLMLRIHRSSLSIVARIIDNDCTSVVREDFDDIPEFEVDTDVRSAFSMQAGF
jgi:hypothetical protein